MNKIYLNLLLVILGITPSWLGAQQHLSLADKNVATETSFGLEISLENQNPVAALQFDLHLEDAAFDLQQEHKLADRAGDHDLAVQEVSPGIIRVVMFSPNGKNVAAGSGKLLTLNLRSRTFPGTYELKIREVTASDAQGNELEVSAGTGIITVAGPRLEIMTASVDFGRVPLGENPGRTVRLRNPGNELLVINAVSEVAPFEVKTALPVEIQPGQETTLAIGLTTEEKWKGQRELSFSTNDPDPLRNLQEVSLSAEIYAVNEIHLGQVSGNINTEIAVPVSIKNMEPYSGFQFDVRLPQDIFYVPNSVSQTDRSTNQQIAINVLEGNILRVVAYSASNTPFSGNEGEVFSFKLMPKISSGTYTLPISEAIISNPELGDILSDTYNGSLSVNAPSFSMYPNSISFGEVPVTETQSQSVNISNYGNAPLVIEEIFVKDAQLSTDVELPLEVESYGSKTVNITYTPKEAGEFQSEISFRHNGPREINVLRLTAEAFSPVYLEVPDQEASRNETSTIAINLNNNEPVRAVQFDLQLPAGFTLEPDDVVVGSRTQDFSVSVSRIEDQVFRFLLYSTSNASVATGGGTILEIPVFIEPEVALGPYEPLFSEIVISGETNENIASQALKTGIISVVEAPEVHCRSLTLELNEEGKAELKIEDIDDGSTAAGGIATMELSKSSFGIEDVGEQQVSLTVTDNNGVSASCTATVTVVDKVAPVASCKNFAVKLNEEGIAQVTAEQLDAGSRDASGITAMQLSQTSFTAEGEYQVTLSITDANGNSSSCDATVTVLHQYAVSNYLHIESREMELSQKEDIQLHMVNEQPVMALQFDLELPTGFSLEPEEVTLAARVEEHNHTVTPLGDNRFRILIYSASNSEIAPGKGAILHLPIATSPGVALGSYEVPLSGVVLAGSEKDNIASAALESGSLEVVDTTAPEVLCQEASVLLDEYGKATLLAERVDNGSTDAAGIASMEVSPASFTTEDLGEQIITLTVTDVNGNSASCTTTVTVLQEDTEAPVADVPELGVLSGACEVTDIPVPTATDAVNGNISATTQDPLEYPEQGRYVITWTYTDQSGNTATQEQTVVVEDLTPPEIRSKAISLSMEGQGVEISPEDLDNGTTDNCGGVTLSLDRNYFEAPGEYEVVLTATDEAGNSSEALVLVSIEEEETDPSAPVTAHVVPGQLQEGSMAKVVLSGGTEIREIYLLEPETNRYKTYRGENSAELQIDVAPFKGTLLLRIIDEKGEVHLKKLIVL